MIEVNTQQLIKTWWQAVSTKTTRDDIERADWDELMTLLGLECSDCEDKDIRISEIDYMNRRYRVTFVLFEGLFKTHT